MTTIENQDEFGRHDEWKATNWSGEKLASGIYIYVISGKDNEGRPVNKKIGKFNSALMLPGNRPRGWKGAVENVEHRRTISHASQQSANLWAQAL